MIQKSEFPFNSEDEAPFYFNLKRVQEDVVASYPAFPLQSNKDFFEKNYEKIVKVAAMQIEYLYAQLRDNGKPGSPHNNNNNNTSGSAGAGTGKRVEFKLAESSNYQKLVAEN